MNSIKSIHFKYVKRIAIEQLVFEDALTPSEIEIIKDTIYSEIILKFFETLDLFLVDDNYTKAFLRSASFYVKTPPNKRSSTALHFNYFFKMYYEVKPLEFDGHINDFESEDSYYRFEAELKQNVPEEVTIEDYIDFLVKCTFNFISNNKTFKIDDFITFIYESDKNIDLSNKKNFLTIKHKKGRISIGKQTAIGLVNAFRLEYKQFDNLVGDLDFLQMNLIKMKHFILYQSQTLIATQIFQLI